MLSVALSLALAVSAHATSTGVFNHSTTGCGTCHGATASATTSAAFGSIPATVPPGTDVVITFTVSTSDPDRIAAGLDVSATGGTLQAGANTRIFQGEITHSAPEPLTAGAATFTFTWTAPLTEGNYALRGAGNAVDGNGMAQGGAGNDGWALAADLVIVVSDECDDADLDGFDSCNECDDNNAEVHPEAPEIWYDGIDQNCDGNDTDQDGDGAGTDTDCVDTDPSIFPGAPDVFYDGIDQNCDGASDFDRDADGFDAAPPVGQGEDCDDDDAAVNPGADDPACDGLDLDCDPAPDTDPTCAEQEGGSGKEDVIDERPEPCGCRSPGSAAGLPALALLWMAMRSRRRPVARHRG